MKAVDTPKRTAVEMERLRYSEGEKKQGRGDEEDENMGVGTHLAIRRSLKIGDLSREF